MYDVTKPTIHHDREHMACVSQECLQRSENNSQLLQQRDLRDVN